MGERQQSVAVARISPGCTGLTDVGVIHAALARDRAFLADRPAGERVYMEMRRLMGLDDPAAGFAAHLGALETLWHRDRYALLAAAIIIATGALATCATRTRAVAAQLRIVG